MFVGSDENSEPQPIPSLLLGCEKDAANVSPYALRFWVSISVIFFKVIE